MTARGTVRCAIYTRKSTDEGLDQDFNSLDAQREACSAFIASQRREGWREARERYDDGGLSGATLERPALQRLLADIEHGRVGMVVVYKIDRLTRSLADFARIVERLDAAGCSFVSVTQAFNTASSMGRLTLNVLLSFAQFEREITAERIRDKIAASKKKGMWMGGMPPLGYDPHPDPKARTLVVNGPEAETVRTLFHLYRDLLCLRQVEIAAARDGLRSKVRRFADGRTSGGALLSRGQIHKVLTNPVYLGRIRHKDRIWPGLHEAIVTEDLWQAVQDRLIEASRRPRRGRAGHALSDLPQGPPRTASLLAGRLFDETGEPMTPTHTSRNGKRYRYHVSRRLMQGTRSDRSGWRLPAEKLERTVVQAVADHLAACADRHRLLVTPDIEAADRLKAEVATLAADLRALAPSSTDIVERASLAPGTLSIALDRTVLAERLHIAPDLLAPSCLSFATGFDCRRRGVEIRIVSGDRKAVPDRVLLDALGKAHDWLDDLKAGRSLGAIARDSACTPAFVRTRLQLALLSPALQAAIVEGRQPETLTLETIVRLGVPVSWAEQATRFGFED